MHWYEATPLSIFKWEKQVTTQNGPYDFLIWGGKVWRCSYIHRWNKGCKSQRVAYCAPWVMGLDVLCPHAFHRYLPPFMTEKSFLKNEDTDLFHACHFSLASNYKVSSWRSGILYRKSIGGQLLANSSSVGKSRSFLSSFSVLIRWFPISIIFLFLLPHSAIGAISPLSSFYWSTPCRGGPSIAEAFRSSKAGGPGTFLTARFPFVCCAFWQITSNLCYPPRLLLCFW